MRINCRQASRLISESMDRRLSLFERAALFFHMLACDMCTNYRKQLHKLRRMVVQWADRLMDRTKSPGFPQGSLSEPSLSPEAKERIKRQLKS